MRSSKIRVLLVFSFMLIAMITAAAVYRGKMLITCLYEVPSQSSGKLRIVGLADLHGNAIGEKQEQLIKAVTEADPDLVVYLGDMLEKTNAEESAEVLIKLTEQLVELVPVYYVDGNHELDIRSSNPEIYRQMNEKLEDLGAVHLENEICSFNVGDENTAVNLCGITRHYYWGTEEDALTKQLKQMRGINILLCHYPESVLWYDAFAGGGLDAALCGHTHGGLVRIPFFGGLYAPEQGWRPRYDVGKYSIYTDTDKNNYGGSKGSRFLGTMIISGGLAGEHGIPRINNPREISVIDICPEPPAPAAYSK